MNTIELLKRIKRNLREKKSAIAEKMIEGRISDFQSYQKDVGIAQGLEDACIIIDETLTKLDEGDE
jgi:CRISPR/Cas system-associated endonuclease Cas1